MWLWLWVPLISLNLTCSHATLIPRSGANSVGPTSNEEAEVLFKEGQKAIRNANYGDAAYFFRQLLDRYPSHPEMQKVRLFLGESLLNTGKPSEAISILKEYLSASLISRDAAKAQLFLGQSYLQLKSFHEAYLTTLDFEHLYSLMDIPSDLKLESLLIRTESLFGLKRKEEAFEKIRSIENQLSDKNTPRIQGMTFFVKLKIKMDHCARFPSSKFLEERQTIDQFERRGTCLLEALLIFNQVMKSSHTPSITQASGLIEKGFQSYFQACLKPPQPPFSPKKNHSLQQTKQYQLELSDFLLKEFQKKSDLAQGLLNSWKADLAPPMTHVIELVLKNLETFRPPNNTRSSNTGVSS